MQRLRVGDLVQVIAGDDKGKQGTITKLLKDQDRAIVEGIKLVTKHQKPNARNQQGGKTTMEAPIHVSNLMPIDPDTKKPTRVRVQEKDGKRVRVAKSGATIEAGK
ncbi:MAG: 50S ribosomal protein L24 [Polyangiaceae bacterium]|nr:50S ribosomal protein L24 [Polyangiaceae bacterium]